MYNYVDIYADFKSLPVSKNKNMSENQLASNSYTEAYVYDDEIGDSENTELVVDDVNGKENLLCPNDNYKVVYLLFYLLGVTSLVPFNFIMPANDYWMYKFRDIKPNSSNYSYYLSKTKFQAEFTSYLNVATSIPNMLFLVLNSLFSHHLNLQCRLRGSMVSIGVAFIVTTVFIEINTDSWQNGFFSLTIIFVAIMSAGSAVMVGSLYGIAGKFSPKYMGAVVAGQSFGGIVASVAQILCLAFNLTPLHTALIYFIFADILIFASLIAFSLICKCNFFMYNISKSDNSISGSGSGVSLVNMMGKIWLCCFNIFCVFVVTMSVYPSVTVLVESNPSSNGTDWNHKFFVPVINYLLYNCGDYFGRLTSSFLLKPENDIVVAILSILRIIFVPLLLVCNAKPRHHLPVLLQYDWQYIIIMVVFSYTNGYLTNITFINTVCKVEENEKDKSSSIIATMLSVGLSVGAAAGLLLVRLL